MAFQDVPLLRRLDRNGSGRLEDADLQAAYADFFLGRLARGDVEAAYRAWFDGTRFQRRFLPWHARDALPTARAVAGRARAEWVEVVELVPSV